MIFLRPQFLLLFLLCCGEAHAQNSSHVSLIAQLKPDTATVGRYTGCWGYVSPAGNEYAIVGGHNGTFIIDVSDSTNVHTVDIVPGTEADWREIKVENHYAYVVSQIFAPGNSMQIIDLSYLPDSVHLAATFDSTFSSAHTIEINDDGDDGFIYVNGPVNSPELGGVHILDISNPEHPVEVGEYSTTFIHDCIVKGNLLYACNSPNQTIDVLDITDRSKPKLISQIACCNNIHSGDLTADGKFLFVTTEIVGTPAHIFDVEDPSNITEVAQYIGEDSTIVHNTYIRGVNAYVANNNGGLRVVNMNDPSFPIEVGYYDTYSGFNSTTHGLFTVYPFFPSGKIIASDREQGLFVFRFDQIKPLRVYCHVEDSTTQVPLFNVAVDVLQTAESGSTNIYGDFKTSFLQKEFPALTLTVKADGYKTATLSRLINVNADSIQLTAELKLLTNVVTPIDSSILNIFPTLVHQTISVMNENNLKVVATLKFFNTLGEMVREFSIPENNLSVSLDISSLPRGMYLAELVEENHSFTMKIILQ